MKRDVKYYIDPVKMGLIYLIFSCSVFSCNSPDKRALPNIVWITSEDNSKHYMSLFDENGVPAPNIESLAEHGIIFTRAFSNAPVCSVARSAIISGCYGPRTFSQFHRRLSLVPLPDSLQMFPYYLRKAGYYTTNNSKEDYNFIKGDAVWDESSKEATWRNRQPGQPFFHISNFTTTHESRLHFSEEDMQKPTKTPIDAFDVQSNHPKTDLFRYTNAYYRDKIQEMDQQVGEVLEMLKEDNLMDDTFIFYYGDHGGVLPGSKGYIYETGLHVPMIVHIPKNYQDLVDVKPGTSTDGFVSFVDLAPTVLNLAGIEIPEAIDGIPFLGEGIDENTLSKRDIAYSYADRFDEKYDLVRGVRKGKFKYLRNYQPYNADGLQNNYRYKQLAYQEWLELHDKQELNEVEDAFFQFKAPEALYDIENDPFETKNLANDPEYLITLKEMRKELNDWMVSMPDLSFFPEFHLLNNATENPTLFGQNNQSRINKYLSIADLSLLPFESARDQLIEALESSDPWERYWALNAATSFRSEAKALISQIEVIAQQDEVLINRTMAGVFLAIALDRSPVGVMKAALYACEYPAEALLMLNSIVLMNSFEYGYEFNLSLDNIQPVVKEEPQVQRRLEYLGVM
ncbi:MAG: sulfatase [Cyclobacteriaceae bacterium]